jgi:hypothetical protein
MLNSEYNLHSFFDLTYFREVGQKYRHIFVHFLVQMKTSKSHSESFWPLGVVSWSRPVDTPWNQSIHFSNLNIFFSFLNFCRWWILSCWIGGLRIFYSGLNNFLSNEIIFKRFICREFYTRNRTRHYFFHFQLSSIILTKCYQKLLQKSVA